MPITFSCPQCNRQFTVSEKNAGKKAKCPGCQSDIRVPTTGNIGIPHNTPKPSSVLVPPPVKNIAPVVRSFHCNSCGAALPIPKNSKGHVVCPSCRNEMVIDSLVKNAEIIDKENINSGVSLNATTAALHKQLVSNLCNIHNIPLDAFEKIEVVREERFCVPSYAFYCNATASYTCEVGKIVTTHTERTSRKGYAIKTTHKDRQWDHLSGNVADSTTVLVSGDKALAEQITKLYANTNVNQLEDVEDLAFPPDTETHKYNLPAPMAFTQYVQPLVEDSLQKKIRKSLVGRDVRKISFGGSNIQKEIVRLLLGVYHTVYKYGNQEYSYWTTGDGLNAWHDKPLPPDAQREKAYNEKKSAASIAAPKSANWAIVCAVICGIIAIFFFSSSVLFGGIIAIFSFYSSVLFGLFWLLLAGGFGYLYTIFKKKADEHNAQLAHAKKDLEAFNAQEVAVKQQFQAQKKALRGIYNDCSGDPAAF